MSLAATLDVLLINPGDRARAYQGLAESLAAIEPPVWAGLIAAFVRQRGFSVAVLDANAEELGADDVAARVEEAAPLLAAVVVYGHNPSASTQVMPAAGAICSAIKNRTPAQRVLLAGGHVAALPERTMTDETADFVCGGEGPVTTVELLAALKSGTAPNLGHVRGLWYRDGQQLISTPPAPLVRELDKEMPGVAWDLLPMGKYRAHNWHCFGETSRQPYAAIYTTLGCPYHCSFCCIHAPFKSGEKAAGYKPGVNSYRLWSPQAVVGEIDTLVRKYSVRHIKFADELFVLNPSHVNTLCDLIIERGYDLNIWAYARVDTLKGPVLEKLKRAGVNWLAVGIEAANARVLDDVGKGYDKDKLREVIAGVRDGGIHVIGNYIFGLPEDTLQTMQETLDLAIELRCEFVNFSCAMAYPGSELYKIAIRENWPLPADWGGFSFYAKDTLPLPTRYLSGTDVLRFRDDAFQRYFSHPGYLDMILRTFGAETLRQITGMASHKIVRTGRTA